MGKVKDKGQQVKLQEPRNWIPSLIMSNHRNGVTTRRDASGFSSFI